MGYDGDIERYYHTRKVRNNKGKFITVESIDTNIFMGPKSIRERD